MDRRVKKVISLMQQDLHREIPVHELARSVNLSPSRLRSLFKSYTQMSIAMYFKLQKMQKAKELLESTFLNIKEVTMSVGINDQSHFVRDFKKVYGVTPSQYRARSINNDSYEIVPEEKVKSASK